MSIKQVIIVREDLNMPLGKLAGQTAHASMLFVLKHMDMSRFENIDSIFDKIELKFTKYQKSWFIDKLNKKVILKVKNEEEMLAIAYKAKEMFIETHVLTDAGLTVFKEPTRTCVAIGPDLSDKIDKITKNLSLL